MTHFMQTAWSEFLGPLFQRPKRLQVAALCYRRGKAGKEENTKHPATKARTRQPFNSLSQTRSSGIAVPCSYTLSSSI